ncbi:MAG: hypothetical protein LC104_06800 [Bacteroidales bacterium]|nr:hypothetical protein [Bacteroidales bacterium]
MPRLRIKWTRKFLTVLREARWRITDIKVTEPSSHAAHSYTLTLDGYATVLPESQLRGAE